MTTGTVAVSGVTLVGCASEPAETGYDEVSTTSPINLSSQLGTTAALADFRSTMVSPGTTTINGISNGIVARTQLRGKVDAVLASTNPNVTVRANQPVDMGFSLRDGQTNAPLANQLVKIQVKLPEGWTTFKDLYTNADGFAGYQAKVLTTTEIRAFYEGTDAHKSAMGNVAKMTVLPATQGAPTQASRTATRTAAPAPAPAPPPPAPGSSLGEKAVHLASLQAGKPYVYGGAGPYNFDCSGLTQYVFKQLGRTLPRTAQQQFSATTRIAPADKQIGDLLFFGTPGNIYHMGIFAGNNKMWVAPRSGQVVQLQTISYSSYYVGRVY